MVIALDIETMPNPDMIDRLPVPEIKTGNLKDPEKIAKKLEEAKTKQIEDMALSPLYGKIACCGLIGKNPEFLIGTEEDIIISILDVLNSNEICTWNGINFDIPFIYKRSLILGINPKQRMNFWMKRNTSYPHCDLMQIWCNWYGYEKLDTVARVILGEGKVEFDVTTIPELLNSEEGIKKLEKYCLQDTILNWKLHKKFEGVLI